MILISFGGMLIWITLALLLGMVIGWRLRSRWIKQ